MRSLLSLTLFLTACAGGTPTSPGQAVPLQSGRYEVVFTAGSGSAGNPSMCSTVSIGNSSLPQTNAVFTATAALDGDGVITLRPEATFDLGWTMTVRPAGNGVRGTVHGAARDRISGSTTVTVDGGSPQMPAELSGGPGTAANSVGGPVAGRVVFSAEGTSYGCSGSEWRITRLE
jgi:hypothetical protein